MADIEETIRRAIPDEFILDPPDGGDVKTVEGVRRMADTITTLRAREKDLTLEGLSLIGRLEAIRETLAGTDIWSLPNDYSTERMAQARMADITTLRTEVDGLRQVNALLMLSFPSEAEAAHSEEWLTANPGAPLSDYPNARQDEVSTLRAENERMRGAGDLLAEALKIAREMIVTMDATPPLHLVERLEELAALTTQENSNG